MKTHQVPAAALHAAMGSVGTDVLFGLVGEGNVFMVDRFVREHGGRHVRAANEAGAMAVGCARHGNRIGVCTVTQGPGLTNPVTPLVEGVKSSTPVVLLTGDTPADDLNRAFSRGWTERRPIAFNMPYEFLWTDAPYRKRPVVLVTTSAGDLGQYTGIDAGLLGDLGLIDVKLDPEQMHP